MKLRLTLALGFVLGVFLCVAGCRYFFPPIPLPVPFMIPLKLWVVLAQGGLYNDPGIEEEGTPPANRTNRGCRFTEFEMQQRVLQLMCHAGLYGPWMVFVSDGQIDIVQWPQLALQPPDENQGRFRHRVNFTTEVAIVPEYHDEDKINIYFTGWVADRDDTTIYGGTSEPNDSWPAYIVINDCGFMKPSGFLFGWTPEVTLDWHVLEHEMTHYLARFLNRCFGEGVNQRCYNYEGMEHVRPNEYNILAACDPAHDPIPLHIPGDFGDTSTEKGEIWDRIWRGNWNDP